MSSLTDYYHNHSTSAPILELDNHDENQYNSSFNKQNESMMHKVKDVVSKLLHPSFLFSSNDDTNSPKRKRSDSIEDNDDERPIDRTTTDSPTKFIKDNEPQVTDDEDNNSRDIPSTEQQKKRRRTANYQNILSTNNHHEDERTSPSLTSTDRVISSSSSNSTPILYQTSLEQNLNERINRLTRSKQRFNIPSLYRGSTSTYDPSKSPLFSVGNRTTTTTENVKLNEFSANHLLATSLATRSQPSTSNSPQSPGTLTNPLSNEREKFGVNYASINARRLPYIERLRRRTLQDCIRHNQTLDNEPLSISTIEEHKSTTTSPVSKRMKAPEKECGIQCDISIVESSTKSKRSFSPIDIDNELLSVPMTKKIQSSSPTISSITIEKEQSPIPIIDITKPKVLGNVTPFSWPKFARAQEEYAKKYPEKCRADAVVPSIIEKSNVNTISTIRQQTNTNTKSIFPFSSSSSTTESIWKCPCCTKEHSAQTPSCSLCHGVNPNYKKLSIIKPPVTVEKEPVLSNKLSHVIAKETSISTPVTLITHPTTTKENILFTSPAAATSAISSTFPLFSTTPVTSLPATTKVNPMSINTTSPIFGTSPIVSPITTTHQNTVVTTAPTATSSTIPMFGITPTVSPSLLTTTTTENPVSTSAPRLLFGTTPAVSPTPIATGNPTTVNNSLLFGVVTTKENAVTTSTPSFFGTTTLDKSVTTSASNFFRIGTAFPSFPSVPSTSLTTAVTSSTAPSTAEVTPSLPTSTPFGAFAGTPTTTVTPVVSTLSSNPLTPFLFAPVSSVPSLTTSTATTSHLFGFSTITSTSSPTTTSITFPVSSTTNAFSNPSNFTSASTTTTSVQFAFGTSSSSSFSLAPASTTLTSSNPSFGFGAGSPSRPFAPASISPMNTNTALPFGTASPFGTSSFSPFSNIGSSNPSPTLNFGSTSNAIQTSAAPVVPTGGFSFTPQPSAVSLFGSDPFASSSGGLSSTPNFGVVATVSTSNPSFQSVSSSASNTLFSTQTFPGSTEDTTDLFNIGNGSSTPNPTRLVLRGKRRLRN